MAYANVGNQSEFQQLLQQGEVRKPEGQAPARSGWENQESLGIQVKPFCGA
ncbi:MAG: hypothetical protein K8H84_04930 [Sulfuricella denitrificans]|nr:hypothetical protein [Sulfuricella denitrificans]